MVPGQFITFTQLITFPRGSHICILHWCLSFLQAAAWPRGQRKQTPSGQLAVMVVTSEGQISGEYLFLGGQSSSSPLEKTLFENDIKFLFTLKWILEKHILKNQQEP